MNNYIELNGDKSWYLEDDIQRPYTYDREWINNQYYIRGKLCHRDDGPAVEWANGNMEYFQYGKHHRIGAPAVESIHGYKAFYENGKLHREDGPAREYSNGKIEYYLCDKYFETKEEWELYKYNYKGGHDDLLDIFD